MFFSLRVRNSLTHNASSYSKNKLFFNQLVIKNDDLLSLNKKPKVIFVLGGPGAGKGTQCELLSNEFGLVHLSAGELLRQEQVKDTDNGRLIDSYLKEGKIVPVEISLNLLKSSIEKLKWNRYLIDGFPRNWDNLQGWNQIMTNVCEIETIIFIDCQENELENRLLSRGLTSGRNDDNIITAKKRFVTFKESTLPIIEHFKQTMGNKLLIINGNQSIEEVYHVVQSSMIQNIQWEIVEFTKDIIRIGMVKDWMKYAALCCNESYCQETELKILDEVKYSIINQVPVVMLSPMVSINGQAAHIQYKHEVLDAAGKIIKHLVIKRKFVFNNGCWKQSNLTID